jgi:hypothetical protein
MVMRGQGTEKPAKNVQQAENDFERVVKRMLGTPHKPHKVPTKKKTKKKPGNKPGS